MRCLCFVLLSSIALSAAAQTKNSRPNIVLIMADDMGYSDIGCYGSEIPTPNLDKLASNGVRFSQFYNTSRCCPTRASLLTGLFPHQTGVGHMSEDPQSRKNGKDVNDRDLPGYKGYLNKHCVTMAEVLKTAGYHTYMAGKWHLGFHEQEKWPLQRGFEKFYGILAGATSYLKPQGGRGLSYNNTKLCPPEGKYYSTDAFADSAVQFLKDQEDQNPFFLYLAFNAPHWPLQAKEEDIKLFANKYNVGWDKIRASRYQKQLQMGLLEKQWGFSERDTAVRAWERLSEEEKKRVTYRMAVYAAQIKSLDDNVGKVIAALKQKGVYDNTLIIFLSDNGACAETYQELGSQPDSLINNPDFSGAVSYGMGWANASNTPFRKWKNRAEEGGISAPFIMQWPNGITTKNKIKKTPAYLIDIMPTILEVSGASYPGSYNGEIIYPLTGYSLQPCFTGKQLKQHEYMFWEHENNAAVRKGDYKAVHSITNNTWVLYNLSDDRSEMNDISPKQPALLKELKIAWERWAKANFVLPNKKPMVLSSR